MYRLCPFDPPVAPLSFVGMSPKPGLADGREAGCPSRAASPPQKVHGWEQNVRSRRCSPLGRCWDRPLHGRGGEGRGRRAGESGEGQRKQGSRKAPPERVRGSCHRGEAPRGLCVLRSPPASAQAPPAVRSPARCGAQLCQGTARALPPWYLFSSLFSLVFPFIFHFSQNHRMVGVGRDLCGSSSPTLLPKQGHLQ